MFDKTAAIETFLRRGLAVAIGRASQAQGVIDDRRQLGLHRPCGADLSLMGTAGKQDKR